uniref:Phlebovirus_G2 domain-containing protein n=1 Tax=Panagrellus redivivus TaxID=6233 RepID=A0A7E4W7S2_PANRE
MYCQECSARSRPKAQCCYYINLSFDKEPVSQPIADINRTSVVFAFFRPSATSNFCACTRKSCRCPHRIVACVNVLSLFLYGVSLVFALFGQSPNALVAGDDGEIYEIPFIPSPLPVRSARFAINSASSFPEMRRETPGVNVVVVVEPPHLKRQTVDTNGATLLLHRCDWKKKAKKIYTRQGQPEDEADDKKGGVPVWTHIKQPYTPFRTCTLTPSGRDKDVLVAEGTSGQLAARLTHHPEKQPLTEGKPPHEVIVRIWTAKKQIQGRRGTRKGRPPRLTLVLSESYIESPRTKFVDAPKVPTNQVNTLSCATGKLSETACNCKVHFRYYDILKVRKANQTTDIYKQPNMSLMALREDKCHVTGMQLATDGSANDRAKKTAKTKPLGCEYVTTTTRGRPSTSHSHTTYCLRETEVENRRVGINQQKQNLDAIISVKIVHALYPV